MSAPSDSAAAAPLVLLSKSEAATHALGAGWARVYAAGNEPLALISLKGPLGAGKTQLAKGIVEGLGGDPHEVTSPTFTLLDIHPTPAAEVHHLDCYRLDDEEAAFDVGLEASFSAPQPGQRKVVLIEWASRVEGLLPAGAELREIELAHVEQSVRRLTVHGFSPPERAALRHVSGDPEPRTETSDP